MGWTTTHKPSHISAKQYIESNLLTWTSSTHDYRVLDGGVVKFRTYYGAVERVERATGAREVFAMIFLLSYNRHDYYNFGYKDMDESMGPYQYDCPQRILDLLTPTTNANALTWRAACRATHTARRTSTAATPAITVGTRLQYGGHTYTVLDVLGRRGYSVTNPAGRIYRMRSTQARQATVI